MPREVSISAVEFDESPIALYDSVCIRVRQGSLEHISDDYPMAGGIIPCNFAFRAEDQPLKISLIGRLRGNSGTKTGSETVDLKEVGGTIRIRKLNAQLILLVRSVMPSSSGPLPEIAKSFVSPEAVDPASTGFLHGIGPGIMKLRSTVAFDKVSRFDELTGGTMFTDDEILAMAKSCTRSLRGYGKETERYQEARSIVHEIRAAMDSEQSIRKRANTVVGLALDILTRKKSIGNLRRVVNSRLRKVGSVGRGHDVQAVRTAVTEACGDLAELALLAWEGLNRVPREAAPESVFCRASEVSAEDLEVYQRNVRQFIAWSGFTSVAATRLLPTDAGEPGEGNAVVIFEIRSAGLPRVGDEFVIHPFSPLQIEGIRGCVVRLVEPVLVSPQGGGGLVAAIASAGAVTPRFDAGIAAASVMRTVGVFSSSEALQSAEVPRSAVRAATLESRATADLSMSGGDNFGFVTSAGDLDILALSRFAEADAQQRLVSPQSQNAILMKVGKVIQCLKAHAEATGHVDGGDLIVGLFERAMWRSLKMNKEQKDVDDKLAGRISCADFQRALEARDVNREEAARKIRDAAIRAYTMGELSRDAAGYLYTDLNRALRKVTSLTSLKDEAIRGAIRVALDERGLWPYADLLMDVIRKLDPTSESAVWLYRGQSMDEEAIEHLRQRTKGVVAFTSFTSFSDNEQRARDFKGNVLWKLQSSGRMKVGSLSEFPQEEECLLPPGSSGEIVRVYEDEDDRTVIEVRDLPLLDRRALLTGDQLREDPSAADLRLKGGPGFGFVTSAPALDVLTLSRFIDADAAARAIPAGSLAEVQKKVPSVIAALAAHANAKQEDEGGKILCDMFRDALASIDTGGQVTTMRAIRDAAVRAYTMSRPPTGYMFSDLNRNLRNVVEFKSLDFCDVRKSVDAVLEESGLVPYADLLFDAIRKLDPTSVDVVPLYRGQQMSEQALDHLLSHEGAVLAFTSFTSFADDKAAAIEYVSKQRCGAGMTRVLWELESSRRMKIGGFSEFPGEEECLLPPGSAAEIIGFEKVEGQPTVVRLRDLPVVKKAKKLPDKMQSKDVAPGLRRGVRPMSGRTTILHREAEGEDAAAVAEIAENYPELVNAQDEDGRTPLWIASQRGHVTNKGKASVINALLKAGADPKRATKDGTTPMHVAAGEGHLEVLKALHAYGAGLEAETEDGETPIFAATRAKQGRVVAWLQVNGADVNRARKDGQTPLRIAAESGVIEVAMTLAALGAKINVIDQNDWTPLQAAAAAGHSEVVRALKALHADVNLRSSDGMTPVYMAAAKGHLEVVKALASLGADLNVSANDGTTPLCIAAQEGHVDVVKALASFGADVNVPNGHGATPIFVGAAKGDLEVVQALASLGADVTIPAGGGVTPVFIAALAGHMEMVKKLASLGADVTVPSNDGWTPICVAAQQGHVDVVQALASLGADVNMPANDGTTPVCIAAQQGNLDVVKALASLGADVTVPRNDGATPVLIAACKGHVEVVRALASLGADVNVARNDGATPVFVAAQNGHAGVVNALASVGADVSVPTNDGTTPVCIATQEGHVEIVEALASLGSNAESAGGRRRHGFMRKKAA